MIKLATSTEYKRDMFQQMLNISVNFDFCLMKKLRDLAHEKLVNILGGPRVGTNIHGCQPYLNIAIYVLKSANGGLLCGPLYSDRTLGKTFKSDIILHRVCVKSLPVK